MKSKYLYILAALLAFGAAGATSSRTKSTINVVYVPQANGGYRLFLFGGDRTLVCEEKPLRIVEQGDAINPVVLECKH